MAHAIRSSVCLDTTDGRSFVVNDLFEEPKSLERYEAAHGKTQFIMAPCHASSGFVAPHSDSVTIAAPHRDSVMITVDGGCRRDGLPDALAAFTVLFSPYSRYNISQVLATDDVTHTSQRAELTGGIEALKLAKCLVIPRRLLPKGMMPGLKQVVIKTDSEYLCFSATEWIAKWKSNKWKDTHGKRVENRGLFQELDNRIRELEGMDILVQFWHVPRENNREADALTNKRLDEREKAASLTHRRSTILVLCLESQSGFSSEYRDFMIRLEDLAKVRLEDSVESALIYLGRNKPDAVIVADAFLANECSGLAAVLMSRLKEFAESGGTVVFGCMFSSSTPRPDLSVFFSTHFGFPWETGSHRLLTAEVSPPVHNTMQRGSILWKRCTHWALHLKNVDAGARLYELTDCDPEERTETPVAWAKFGQGWIGYIGDVYHGKRMQRTILAMCNLSFK